MSKNLIVFFYDAILAQQAARLENSSPELLQTIILSIKESTDP